MVDIALELVKNDDSKRRGELEALRIPVVIALEPRPCFFSRIPVEIQSDIFTLIIRKSNSRMLALTFVCRSWRGIILNMPILWRHLVLTQNTTNEQVDTWLQRSGGLLSRLSINMGFYFGDRPRIFKNASAHIWSSLDILEILDRSSINRILPPDAAKQLRLWHLTVGIVDAKSDFQLLCDMDTSRTRSLAINSFCGVAPLEKLTFRSLTTLMLGRGFNRRSVLSLFESSPLLEIVVLDHSDDNLVDFVTEKVKLVHLKSFVMRYCYRAYYYLGNTLFPNLETLELRGVNILDSLQCFEALAKQTLTQLQRFSLRECTYSSDALIPFLRASSTLKELILSDCRAEKGDENLVVTALAGTAGTKQDPLQEACCPLLQHLNLSQSASNLTFGSISCLIKARLASNAARSESESDSSPLTNEDRARPLPILSLNIDACHKFESDELSWLRERVPHVSAIPATFNYY